MLSQSFFFERLKAFVQAEPHPRPKRLLRLLMSLLNLASFVSSNLGAFITHLLEVNESVPWF